MSSVIESEFQDATAVVVTHRMSSIHTFDKVMVLDAGKLVEYGSPATLLADPTSPLQQLYKAQNSSVE